MTKGERNRHIHSCAHVAPCSLSQVTPLSLKTPLGCFLSPETERQSHKPCEVRPGLSRGDLGRHKGGGSIQRSRLLSLTSPLLMPPRCSAGLWRQGFTGKTLHPKSGPFHPDTIGGFLEGPPGTRVPLWVSVLRGPAVVSGTHQGTDRGAQVD